MVLTEPRLRRVSSTDLIRRIRVQRLRGRRITIPEDEKFAGLVYLNVLEVGPRQLRRSAPGHTKASKVLRYVSVSVAQVQYCTVQVLCAPVCPSIYRISRGGEVCAVF